MQSSWRWKTYSYETSEQTHDANTKKNIINLTTCVKMCQLPYFMQVFKIHLFFQGAVLWTREWTSSDSAWRSCRKTDVCHTAMGIPHKPTKSIDMEIFPHTSHLYWLDADREYRGETQVHIVWQSLETILKLTNEV